MSKIAVFGEYGYWCDGRGWKAFGETGTEEAVVVQLASIWAGHDEGFVVEDTIGIDIEEARTKIEQSYHYLLEEQKRNIRISQLNAAIKHSKNWLDNMESEKARQQACLERCQTELDTLTGEQ